MFNKDIFDANLKEMVPKNFEKKDWNDDTADICLVGNLPFNISLPLTFKLLKEISVRHGTTNQVHQINLSTGYPSCKPTKQGSNGSR